MSAPRLIQFLDFIKANLDRFISVGFQGLDLGNKAGAGLDYRYRHHIAALFVELGHAYFFTE